MKLITNGRYSVWFKTPIGEGAGLVEFDANGKLSGNDSTFAYAGHCKQDGERFKAPLSATRIAPGPPGVFGMDAIDITLVGHFRWRSLDFMYWLCKAIAGSEVGGHAHSDKRRLDPDKRLIAAAVDTAGARLSTVPVQSRVILQKLTYSPEQGLLP